MTMTLMQAGPDEFDEIIGSVAQWQTEGAPVHLHPGDLGWNATMGADRLASETFVWRRDGGIVAVGMGDSDVVRMALAPVAGDDDFRRPQESR